MNYLLQFSASTIASTSTRIFTYSRSLKNDLAGRVKRQVATLILAALLSPALHAEDQILAPAGAPFSFDWLKGYAKDMAKKPYRANKVKLPETLQGLDWFDYQEIQFNHDAAIWHDDKLAFRTELFHLGHYFTEPVQIYELEGGVVNRIEYSSSFFDYGDTGIKTEELPNDLGYAGFRMQFYNDWTRDVLSFLGASYFRAVDKTMQYGLSARGLAIDTALPKPEEFPMFTHFWIKKPKPADEKVTIYALLDSPSATGAYRFVFEPGDMHKTHVDMAIYPRKDIKRLGIAPMTSMYMLGENDRDANWDWRPEIHDSDGLAMHAGNGEWIWRPLVNPDELHFNSFSDDNPKGFGLMQRDLNYEHYQDDELYYELRPSLWIEPQGDWGKGAVELVEIPALDETFDNIVAFWNPAEPVKAGQELLYSYNMYWGTETPIQTKLAHVVNTFTGLGGDMGKKRQHYSRRFVIDFEGGMFPMLSDYLEVKPVISTSAGKIELVSVHPKKTKNGYRLMFDLVPPDNSTDPINIRAHLEVNDREITETWLNQWTPPPQNERNLRNAGHLE